MYKVPENQVSRPVRCTVAKKGNQSSFVARCGKCNVITMRTSILYRYTPWVIGYKPLEGREAQSRSGFVE